jgi:hypothetical protein
MGQTGKSSTNEYRNMYPRTNQILPPQQGRTSPRGSSTKKSPSNPQSEKNSRASLSPPEGYAGFAGLNRTYNPQASSNQTNSGGNGAVEILRGGTHPQSGSFARSGSFHRREDIEESNSGGSGTPVPTVKAKHTHASEGGVATSAGEHAAAAGVTAPLPDTATARKGNAAGGHGEFGETVANEPAPLAGAGNSTMASGYATARDGEEMADEIDEDDSLD